MAIKYRDLVEETSTTEGTISMVLLGAKAGSRGFVAAIGAGGICIYVIRSVDDSGVPTDQFEFGIGTVSTGPDTLSRDEVISNSLGDLTKINFAAGTKAIYVTVPDAFRGIEVQRHFETTGAAVQIDATAIPNDDTVPLITEGVEVFTKSYTPRAAGNIIEVTCGAFISVPANRRMQLLIFQGSVNIGTAAFNNEGGPNPMPIQVTGQFIAADTNPVTISARGGTGSVGGGVYMNATSSGVRQAGGSMASFFRIKEYTPTPA